MYAEPKPDQRPGAKIGQEIQPKNSWEHLPDLRPDPFHGDIHGLDLSPGESASHYATTPFGISTSTDAGDSWALHEFPRFRDSDARSYRRGVAEGR